MTLEASYPVIVRGVWVLVTGDDLGGHPVRGPDEGVSPPDGAIQLSAHTEVDCGEELRVIAVGVWIYTL